MSGQNLIIYKFNGLYQILEELSLDLNFKITHVDNENYLSDTLKNLKKPGFFKVFQGAEGITFTFFGKKVFRESFGTQFS